MKFLSLRWKISGILVISNLLLGAIVVFIVSTTVKETLENELIERGKAIGKDLAHYCAEQIMEEDAIGLKQTITNLLSFETGQYILIQDSEGRLITDTFNSQVPIELTQRSVYDDADLDHPKLIHLSNLDVDCYDIIIPVEEGAFGYIRIGMKRSYIMEKVQATNNYIILTVLIVTFIGILIVFFVANNIIKPILYLANRANEISKGQLEEKIKVTTNDEIKFVAEAIERLRESLNMALTRLKKHQSSRI